MARWAAFGGLLVVFTPIAGLCLAVAVMAVFALARGPSPDLMSIPGLCMVLVGTLAMFAAWAAVTWQVERQFGRSMRVLHAALLVSALIPGAWLAVALEYG